MTFARTSERDEMLTATAGTQEDPKNGLRVPGLAVTSFHVSGLLAPQWQG